METLSLQTLALLEVLKDPTKLKYLPRVYINLCSRIIFHIKAIHKTKTEIYKRNCIVGSHEWFNDLKQQIFMFYGYEDCTNPIDDDIIAWCEESLEKLGKRMEHDDDVCPVCCSEYWRYSKWSCDQACACDIISHSEGSDSDSDY